MKKLLFICGLMLFSLSSWAQTKTITGKIQGNQADSLLIGALVVQKGTPNAVETDEGGNFSIEVSDTGKVILLITYDNYKAKEVEVGTQTNIVVKLEEEEVTQLEEVVIVGYGVVKKSDLTGSVASVKTEEINKVPTANVLESVQGKVAGVDITRTSGSAGAKPVIAVRGNRSITAGNDPLYIVDGVQYSNIEDINSNDIQSMEVLKDASSTAIYGSRGSNGVIIITTKSNKYEKGTDKIKVFFNAYSGISTPSGFPKALSGTEFVKLKREAFRDPVTGVYASDANIFPAPGEFDYVKSQTYTDYVDKLLHNGHQNDIQVGVAGGNEKLRTYFSVDYYNEKGVLKLDELKRYTARMNLDYQVNRVFKVGTQTQVIHYDQSKRFNPMGRAFLVTPIGPAFDSTGTMVYQPYNYAQGNPLADEQPNAFINKVETTRLFPTLYAEVAPIKGLTLRTNVSFTLGNIYDAAYYAPLSLQQITTGRRSLATITQKESSNKNWQLVANYIKQIKNHSVTLTALSELVESRKDTINAQGQDLLADYQLYHNMGSSSATSLKINTGYERSAIVSYAGRVNYGYKSRYLLTATGRFDGASVLAEGNQWDFFPSVAAAWRIAEERFLRKQKIFNEIKLRASYGVAGNSSVNPYSSQTTVKRIPFAYDENNAAGYSYSTQVGNPNLKWEKSRTVDIGLDLGILENRIQFTGDVYITHTSDLLLNRLLPPSTGVSFVTDNVGKTVNRGIELAVTSTNIRKKNFSWSTTITFMKNKEKITELTGGVKVLDIGTSNRPQYLVVGNPVNSFYDYEKVGIWQLNQADEAAKYGKKPGEIRVKNQDGDTLITSADRIVVGSNTPKFSLGFNNTLKYKSWELNFYFFARVGQTINLRQNATIYDQSGTNNSANVAGFDYWTPENPTNDLPRPRTGANGGADQFISTTGYRDGSFLKLRSVNISYVLPKTIAKKYFKAENLKVYVTGRNLLTWGKIKNYDPEMSGGFTNPLVRLYTVGINVEF